MATVFDKTRHTQMWTAISNNIEEFMRDRGKIQVFYDAKIALAELKLNTLKDMNVTKIPLGYCFACQYAWNLVKAENPDADKADRCIYCPLVWSTDKCYSNPNLGTEEIGLYHELTEAVVNKQYVIQHQIAAQISNLATKSGVKTGTDNTGTFD